MYDAKMIGAHFGKAANVYASHAYLQREILTRAAKLAKRFIPAGTQVLDIGCGAMPLAAVSGTRWQVLGLDYAYAMCQQARTQHHIQCVVADAQTLPFNHTSVDAIFSSLMLQWANDPATLFAECARVLRPGGVMVFSTFGMDTLHELRTAFEANGAFSRISQFTDSTQLSNCIQAAGFVMTQEKTDIITEHYPDVATLMQNLRAIGASNKRHDRPKGLATPRLFNAVQDYYAQHFADTKGLRVSWQVRYGVLVRSN